MILIYNHRCLGLLYVGSINPIQLFSKTQTWNKTFHQTWKFMTWSLPPSSHHVVSVKVQFRNGSLSNRWPLSRDKMIHLSTLVCIGLSKFKILVNFLWFKSWPVHFMAHIYDSEMSIKDILFECMFINTSQLQTILFWATRSTNCQ